jgi:hypothetical protein
MHRLSAAAILVLLGEVLFPGVALAQSPMTFRGSLLRTAFGADVLVSATSRGNQEILRIYGTSRTVQPFLTKQLPMANGPEPAYPFQMTIGPAVLANDACRWTAGSLKALEACFSGRKALSAGPGLEFIPLERLSEDTVAVLFRTRGVVPGYARCLLMLPTQQLTSNCTVYFEQAGEWHDLHTSSLAVRNMKLFQCSALELRNAIWPGAPRVPDSCRK